MQIICLSVAWVILAAFMARHLQRLAFEVARLPQFNHSAKRSLHSMVGLNIRNIPLSPANFQNQKGILLFASPTCRPCHEELEKAIIICSELNIALTCIVSSDDVILFNSFVGKYGNRVVVHPTSDSVLAERGVIHFPTLLFFDESGTIKFEIPSTGFLGKLLSETYPEKLYGRVI